MFAVSTGSDKVGVGDGIMQKTWAGAHYVHTRVNVYYSNRIELRWNRSVHYCDTCDIGASGTPGATPGVRGHGCVPCGAVHYGRCTPVSYPFPQNYRKKSPMSPSIPGSIPVAKVIPTRPVKAQPESSIDQSRVTEVESEKADVVDGVRVYF